MKSKENNKSITKKVQDKTEEGVKGIGEMFGNFFNMFTGGMLRRKE